MYLLRYLILLFLSLLFLTAAAQHSDSSAKPESKFYTGLGLHTTNFHIYYQDRTGIGEVRAGYYTPVTLHLGYRLSDRARVQVGASYGGDKDQSEVVDVTSSGQHITYEALSRTNAFALPVTAQFTLLTVKKRFPVYATASVIPAFGSTYYETWQVQQGVKLNEQSARDRGMNVFATGGIGFNYKISSRFQGFAEYLFYKDNLTGPNSFYYDWEHGFSRLRRIYKSLALGVNYSL